LIDVVRAPTGDHARAKLLAAQPSGTIEAGLRHDSIDGIRNNGSGAKPRIILKAGGHRHRRGITTGRIAGKADFDVLQLPNSPVAHKLRRDAKLHPRPLLTADLQNAPGGVDGIAEIAAFGNGERCRFLQVDVFACADGIHRQNGVLMVGSGDDDGVDILVRQQVVIVAVPGNTVVGLPRFLCIDAVDQRLRIFNTPGAKIADRHNAGVLKLPDTRHIMSAGDAAGADCADVDAIARRHLAEDTRWHDGRKASGRNGAYRSS